MSYNDEQETPRDYRGRGGDALRRRYSWEGKHSSSKESAFVNPQPSSPDEPAASWNDGSSDELDPITPEALPESPDQYSRTTRHYEHRKGRTGALAQFSRGQKRALTIIAVLAILLSTAGGLFAAWWQNTQSSIALPDASIKEDLTQTTSTEPFWTLILGSDSRSESTDRARSDVIMLMRVDPSTKVVTLVSIPRDTKVTIAGYGTQKINAAYSLGGAKLAIKTIEAYSGVDISHYVEIYFNGFSDLVDELGGITVDVPEYCSYKGVTLEPGKQVLNGKEALTFARCRKTYVMGDFTRTECQRLLVKAIATKILAEDATQIPMTISSLSKCFSTDMSLTDVGSIATQLQGISQANVYMAMAPSTTGTVDGVSYTFTYVNQWKLIMQKASNGEKTTLTKKEQEICGWDSTSDTELDMSDGLSSSVQAALQKYWDKKAAAAAQAASQASATGTTTGTTMTSSAQ